MDNDTPDLFTEAPAPGDSLTLGNYAERAYLDYAVSVVKGRALPDVCDGQKPVQRRILFAMNDMGLSDNAKPVKSARVVGDVLGKYHPHGDQSAYDALVRLAQDFSMRYPLIDGQGNFGSRDGDGAAAMRYTEARLTPIAKLLLDEINQGTVDFMKNYDGEFDEPRLLPARLPFVLLNGASGIAVGLATEIPSHNLREVAAAAVAMIRNPKLSHAELMQMIPGPDFPGGGQIISSEAEIAAAYETGRGSLKVRARWKIEELARGQWQLVITELPPNTAAQKVLEEIEEQTNPKIKLGKKTLTPEQLQTRQTMLALLDAVRDESGKDAPVRLVFEPKSSRIDQTEFVNTLLAHTSLESNASLNLVMVGADGRPRQKGVSEILQEWIGFRFATVTRRTRHRLSKVDDRIHILEGRMIVFLNIDEVIRIIRESDEPKPALMTAFGLSDRQAEDILEIRLRQLARLEKIKIEKELAELRDEKAKLEELLGSESAMKRLLIKEIEGDARQYGDERPSGGRTGDGGDVAKGLGARTERAWARPGRLRLQGGRCAVCGVPVPHARHADCVGQQRPCLFGGGGAAAGRPWRRRAGHLVDRTRVGQPSAALLRGPGGSGLAAGVEQRLWLYRQGRRHGEPGEGRQVLYDHRRRRGAARADADAAGRDPGRLSGGGRLLVFGLDEMKTLSGGGRGVTLMALDDKETLTQALAISKAGVVLLGTGRGGKAYEETLSGAALAPHIGKRARKGRAPDTRLKVFEMRPVLPVVK
jgi:topoisomerase-4 subunit A